MEEEYDQLSWDFIKDTLKEIRFNHEWVHNIMACIETSKLTVLWNGEQLDWFNPKRGIHQGDSMSPYIFVLCNEHFGLARAVMDGVWKAIKLSRHAWTHFVSFILC